MREAGHPSRVYPSVEVRALDRECGVFLQRWVLNLHLLSNVTHCLLQSVGNTDAENYTHNIHFKYQSKVFIYKYGKIYEAN